MRGKGIYHEQGPDGVVCEDHRGSHEHGETDECSKLEEEQKLAMTVPRSSCAASLVAQGGTHEQVSWEGSTYHCRVW